MKETNEWNHMEGYLVFKEEISVTPIEERVSKVAYGPHGIQLSVLTYPMQSTWENLVDYDLSESGVHPVTLRELCAWGVDLDHLLNAPLGYSQLAMAYGRKGDYAEADLASAQAAYLRGDNKTARDLASRAKTRFAIGTPGWVKADDIVSAKPLPGQKNN